MMGTTYSRALPAFPYGKNGRMATDRITMKGKVATPHRRTIVDSLLGSLQGMRTENGTDRTIIKARRNPTAHSLYNSDDDQEQSVPLQRRKKKQTNNRRNKPRNRKGNRLWKWFVAFCKCSPAIFRHKNDPPVLLLSVHQDQTSPGEDRLPVPRNRDWRYCQTINDQEDRVFLDPRNNIHDNFTSNGYISENIEDVLQHSNADSYLHMYEGSPYWSPMDNTPLVSPNILQDPNSGVYDNLEDHLESLSRFGSDNGKGVVGSSPALRLVKESRQRRTSLRNGHKARRSAIHITERLVVPAMLQQILKDMYIDPELLSELDEEQKQVLFCKLREEQVRRWRERETKLEEEDKKRSKKPKPKPPSKNGKRNVGWLLGSDQNVWVWVMGEHETDKSIEQILEEETQHKATVLAEKEAEALAWQQEAEMLARLQEEKERLLKMAKERDEELRLKAERERQEDERKKQELQEQEQLKLIQARHELRRRRSIDEIKLMKERRSSEIYMSFKESRQTIEKLAEEDSKELEEEWQEQEKKSKKAEEEIRAIARRAREEHRRSMHECINERIQPPLKSSVSLTEGKDKPPIPSKPPLLKVGRPPKPPNRKAILDWFKDTEEPKGSGRNATTKQIEPWFHGIITRQEAEDLLEEEEVGTFLVRVSERIWGYAVSYKGPSRCKHFLIDTTGGNYQFFGTHQITHGKLADLVNFHEVTPISCAGQEKLVRPCCQKQDPPNYNDLFEE